MKRFWSKYWLVCFFWFVSWKSTSLGISINWWPLHIEIHLMCGFIKIGLDHRRKEYALNWDRVKWRGFGWNY